MIELRIIIQNPENKFMIDVRGQNHGTKKARMQSWIVGDDSVPEAKQLEAVVAGLSEMVGKVVLDMGGTVND